MLFATIINLLIVLVHLFIIFSPLLLFFLKIPKKFLKYMLLIPVLVVYHWGWLKKPMFTDYSSKEIGVK